MFMAPAVGPETIEESTMYNNLAANENKRRPQAALGSADIENLDLNRTVAPQDNLGLNFGPADCWPNFGGGITSTPMGSERVPLRNLYPRQNLPEIIQGPEATMYKAPAANENMRRPQAAIGSEREARLAVIENRGFGHNQNLNVPQVNSWPNSGEGIGTSTPLRAGPNIHWSNPSRDPLAELQPRSGSNTFLAFPPEKATVEGVTKQQKNDRNPPPDSYPLPTLASGPDGLYLLLKKTPPVPAKSSWLSMQSKLKGKAESRPLPELPLPLYDERDLDNLHNIQAKNHRLTEHILSQMPNGQSRHRFQHELLRCQLRSEQQVTSFLEGKLGQVSIAPESQRFWLP